MYIPNSTQPKSSTPAELAAFLAKHPSPRKTSGSQIEPYWAGVAPMNSRGYSLSLIQEFLNTVGVIVSRTAIHNFCKPLAPK